MLVAHTRSNFGSSMSKRPNLVGPVPYTSDDALGKAFDAIGQLGSDAFDLGQYAKLDRTNGISADGLHHIIGLLSVLLPLQSTGRFLFKQLQSALMATIKKYKTMRYNNTEYSDKVWVGFVVRKMQVALAHWRDMASHDETWHRAMRGCTCPKKVKELEGLLSRFPLATAPAQPSGKSRRKLEQKNSIGSVGSQDIPSLAPSSAALSSSSSDPSPAEEKSIADSIEAEALTQAMVHLPQMKGALKAMVIKRPAGKNPKAKVLFSGRSNCRSRLVRAMSSTSAR